MVPSLIEDVVSYSQTLEGLLGQALATYEGRVVGPCRGGVLIGQKVEALLSQLRSQLEMFAT